MLPVIMLTGLPVCDSVLSRLVMFVLDLIDAEDLIVAFILLFCESICDFGLVDS